MQKLELVFRYGKSAYELWKDLVSCLIDKVAENSAELYGECMPISSIGRRIKARKSFNVKTQALEIHCAELPDYDLVSLQVEISEPDAGWFSDWIDVFVGSPLFIQAWLVNSDYDFWQNANDPIEYRSRGRSTRGLPMISNGLPRPLRQKIIDTSGNLGLRVLKKGYVEAIGSPMWLSNGFMRASGVSLDDIEQFDFLKVVQLENGVVEIQSAEGGFSDDSSANVQRTLRKVLFENRGRGEKRG